MNFIAYLLIKIETSKNVVRQISKKSQFRRQYHKQHRKQSWPLLKFEQQHLYGIGWSMWKKLSWKKSVLVRCKIVGLFVNIMTADGKYSLLNREKLTQPIKMQ